MWSRDLKVAIPNPCRESWSRKAGDGRERFCGSCSQVVHDFSTLTRREARRLMRGSRGGVCAKIMRDAGGRIKFRPDPASRTLRGWSRLSLMWVSQAIAFAQVPAPKVCAVDVKVSDLTGAGVAGATVSVAQKGTTDGSGVFHDSVPPGRYKLDAQSRGFERYARDISVSCENDAPVKVDVQLQIGSMGAVVEVVEGHPSRLRRFLRLH